MINIRFEKNNSINQFSIDTNFRSAILGENGIGKTSLLSSISNKKSIYEFIEVMVPVNLKIEYFKQIEENKSLSGGEHTRKRLEELFSKKADIYVLDEPTNNLDKKNIDWLEGYILKNNIKIIFTSHNINFIDEVADFIYYIDSSTIEKTKEKCSSYLITRKKRIDTLYSEYKINLRKQNKLIKTSRNLKEKADRGSKYKGTDNDKHIVGFNRENAGKGASTATKILNKAEDLKVDKPEYDPIPEITLLSYNPHPLFNLQTTTLNNKRINLDIKNNTKLIITGTNGIGKTTLLNYIDNTLKGDGTKNNDMFSKYSKFNYIYITQDWYEKLDNVFVKDYISIFNLNEQEIFKALSYTFLDKDILNKKFKDVSPGMRIKILLGILSIKSYDLIMWDEPTNHLDVLTQSVLNEAFIKYNGSLILVTHDKYFTNNNNYELVNF